MNTLNPSLSRDVACAAAATLVTLLVSLSFVQSTSAAPGTPAQMHKRTLQTEPSWFGQPEPAVLVD
ncbi:MAG: hypothetical protein JSR67_08435 [Proteobacteria bacterium]|nr:hypothetical protein [Pseudomonadota bacterium]